MLCFFFITKEIVLIKGFDRDPVFEVSAADSAASVLVQKSVIVSSRVCPSGHCVICFNVETSFVLVGTTDTSAASEGLFPRAKFLFGVLFSIIIGVYRFKLFRVSFE